MFSYKYDETGGYDSMTGAYIIYQGEQRVCKIDMSDFGQESCDYSFKPPTQAEEYAKIITAALNSSNNPGGSE